jgi:hypothetical protein
MENIEDIKLVWLNAGNETGLIQLLTLENLMQKFPDENNLVGLEIGSAYGGGVEIGAKMFGKRGKFYGFDTFEGHPRDLAVDQKNLEAYCMEMWYQSDQKQFSKEKLAYKYQRQRLDNGGLTNAILVKGRINKHSFDMIDKIHFAIIDLDLIVPTRIAYEAIKDKIVVGGYLFMHDALPPDHLPMIHSLVYHQILAEGRWKIVKESNSGNLTALERWASTLGNFNGHLVDLNLRS